MIRKNDISDFFYLEAEAAKKSWEALMSLPVKERIRRRKAIQGVYLDREYREKSDEGHVLLKVTISVNLADFKEGDCLVLHKEGMQTGIKCSLYSFEGDYSIILDVFPPDMPGSVDELNKYNDVPLLLDKDLVDLREHVFYKFLAELKTDNEYWVKNLVNNPTTPLLEDKSKCAEELDDTCKNYDIKLLPKQRDAIINCMAAKDYFLIQGPPGTGKSFVLAWIIIEETCYFKRKVIIIGPNHMAINNTLLQVMKQCSDAYNIFKVGQSYNAPKQVVKDENKENHIENIGHLNVNYFNEFDGFWMIGLTPHSLYTSRAEHLKCDTLIIDEAGQMTIPLALMGMIRAKKVILAGDHKQLPPIISSEEMAEEMKKSIFQVLFTEKNSIMLDTSFRMYEPICNFVSELFYEGKVKPMRKGYGNLIVCDDPLFDFHTPIIIHHVNDYGEQISDKEASFIADIIVGFLNKGLPADEIAVLSPFRAQVANVRSHIRKNHDISEEQRKHVVADTIDKMQGQEREVIIFSLVAGDIDYMTDMAEFLYNPNKLNVAFSRAKSKLIIVGNIEQIKKISSVEYPHIKKMIESNLVKFV